jgi:hypothetical protein
MDPATVGQTRTFKTLKWSLFSGHSRYLQTTTIQILRAAIPIDNYIGTYILQWPAELSSEVLEETAAAPE